MALLSDTGRVRVQTRITIALCLIATPWLASQGTRVKRAVLAFWIVAARSSLAISRPT